MLKGNASLQVLSFRQIWKTFHFRQLAQDAKISAHLTLTVTCKVPQPPAIHQSQDNYQGYPVPLNSTSERETFGNLMCSMNNTDSEQNDILDTEKDPPMKLKDIMKHVSSLVVSKQSRVDIRRNSIWSDYVEARKRPWVKLDHSLRVVFIGEAAVGTGGPRRETFTGPKDTAPVEAVVPSVANASSFGETDGPKDCARLLGGSLEFMFCTALLWLVPTNCSRNWNKDQDFWNVILSWNKIFGMLKVSCWKFARRVDHYGLQDLQNFSPLTNDEIDTIVKDYHKTHGATTGESYLRGHFRALGYHIQCRRIRESINRVDPRNTALGWGALPFPKGHTLYHGLTQFGTLMAITH
eukprot:gene6487-7230_t